MYNKLLVALDGSPLSEGVLPYVSGLVCTTGSEEVLLLRVLEAGGGVGLSVADSYLKGCASRLVEAASFSKCVEWESISAPPGEIASYIVQFAERHGFDLVIISSHGGPWKDRSRVPSVPEHVLREADIPVFLIPAFREGTLSPAGLKRVLVPLDGSEAAEQVLSHVKQFASRADAAEVTLLHVEPVNHLPTERQVTRSVVKNGEDAMLTYLGLAGSLMDADAALAAKVRFGRPAQQIIAEAKEGCADFIAMTSHGQTGAPGTPFGAVAEEVLQNSVAPVLMIPHPVRLLVGKPLPPTMVYRCDNCGRRTYRDSSSPLERCGRCRSYPKIRATASTAAR